MKKYLLLLIILPFIFIQEVKASTIDTINISESQAINYKQHTAGFYQWRDNNWIDVPTGGLMYFNTYFSGINLQQIKYDYFTFNALINVSNLISGTTQVENYHIQGNSFGVSVSYYYYQDSYSNMQQVICEMNSTYSGIFVKCPIPNKTGNLVLDRLHFTIAPPPINATGKFIGEYNVSDFFNFISTTEKDIADINENTQQTQQNTQDTKKAVDDLNDNITSEENPTIDLTLDESSNTPISDLILFPITLLNKLINTIGSDTCSPYTLPFFYDTTITFPCFQLSNYLGSNITNSIDLFICLFMCYNLAMLFISIFEDITSLRDTYDSLYEPKHADTGYKPKHGKE